MISYQRFYNLVFILIGVLFLSGFDYFLQGYLKGIGWMILCAFLGLHILNFTLFGIDKLTSIERSYCIFNFLLVAFITANFVIFSPRNLSDVLFPIIHLCFLFLLLTWCKKNRVPAFLLAYFSLIFIFLSIFADYLDPLNTYRSSGFSGDPNDASSTLVIACLGVFVLSKSYNQFNLLTASAILLCAIGVIFTGSRSGLVCLALLVLPFAKNFISRRNNLIIPAILLGGVFAYAFSQMQLSEDLLERISIGGQEKKLSQDSSRLDVIPIYIKMISENFWGIGFAQNNQFTVKAHNSILNVFASFGHIAGLLFVAMNTILLACLIKARNIHALFLIPFVVIILFSANDVLYKREWLFLVTFIFVFYNDMLNSRKSDNDPMHPELGESYKRGEVDKKNN